MPNSAEIHYFQSLQGNGDSPPVVLIHGAGGNHLFWPSKVRRLPGFNVYAINLPGHGKSPGRGFQSIEQYTQSVLTWLDSLDLYRAIFIGHSMGGAIALNIALQHPEHIIGLGLIGSGARLRVAPAILENTANTQTLPTAISAIISAAFSKSADSLLVQQASKRMNEVRASVLHGDFLACNAFDLIDSLSKIKTPTLVVCGEDDEMTPIRYSQFLADQIPGALFKRVPNAGHMVMLEQPQIVMEILSDFLSTIPFHPGHVLKRADL